MRLSNQEIQKSLSDENEVAEEVRLELQEIIKYECDDNNIPLSSAEIEKMLEKIPDRELAALEPIAEDYIVLSKYARNILRQQGYRLKN